MTKMDRWKNPTSMRVKLEWIVPSLHAMGAQVSAMQEFRIVVKPGETVEIPSAHRREVQDVWCSMCKKPISNADAPCRTPAAVCANEEHDAEGWWQAQGGHGLALVRVLDDGEDAPVPKLAPGLNVPPPSPAHADARAANEMMLERARAQVAARRGAP
jgi:hypothetical protein